ncbi:hypothetical protein NQZ79_g6478 [Umbelopsis isabellina]|nr:hypothetical protein NQZ79_g6478 [Umbelopsis isabellina]
MPQSSQMLHDVADIQTTTATRHLKSRQGSRRSNFEETEEQTINLSTKITKVPLSEEVSESDLPSQTSYLHRQQQKDPMKRPSPALKKRNSQDPKPIDDDQSTQTNTHADFADGGIILTAKQLHVSPEPAGEEPSTEATETQVMIESEVECLDSSSTMKTRFKTADSRSGITEHAGQLHTKDTILGKSPQVSHDTTPLTPNSNHASPVLQCGSEGEGKNMFTTVANSDSYTVRSTTINNRTDSSPLSDIPTSSTDLLSPDIGYEIHTIYPNPIGHNLPEKLGLLNDSQSATIPLSLDASDFDVVPAFPNPTGRRLLEKLALAAQENESSNIAKNYSARLDETVDSASTDEIPSSPIY